jgi:2-polyprenyl-6-methoxyphenol hydroxylase-like FAD-dependent oxidoreductase
MSSSLGTKIYGDVLVGADGVWSSVRKVTSSRKDVM